MTLLPPLSTTNLSTPQSQSPPPMLSSLLSALPRLAAGSRSVHSRRQLNRFFDGPYQHRQAVKKSKIDRPPTEAEVALESLRAKLAADHQSFVSNPISETNPIKRLSNGFVVPPPAPVPPTASPNTPPFRVSRTTKSKGTGFYPIYLKYTANRVNTEMRVSGDVMSFLAALDTEVINPHADSLLAFRSKPDYLDSVMPTGKNCEVTGSPLYKVKVRGRWKMQVENWLWSMNM